MLQKHTLWGKSSTVIWKTFAVGIFSDGPDHPKIFHSNILPTFFFLYTTYYDMEISPLKKIIIRNLSQLKISQITVPIFKPTSLIISMPVLVPLIVHRHRGMQIHTDIVYAYTKHVFVHTCILHMHTRFIMNYNRPLASLPSKPETVQCPLSFRTEPQCLRCGPAGWLQSPRAPHWLPG